MYFSNAANNARHALLQRDEDVAEAKLDGAGHIWQPSRRQSAAMGGMARPATSK